LVFSREARPGALGEEYYGAGASEEEKKKEVEA